MPSESVPERIKCKTCGLEVPEQDVPMHKVKAHGDVTAVQYLKEEEKEDMLRKVAVRNLWLSGIALDIIAMQVDVDVPTVMKIIAEISAWA